MIQWMGEGGPYEETNYMQMTLHKMLIKLEILFKNEEKNSTN